MLEYWYIERGLLELELLKNYKDSNCHKNSLCNASSLKLAHFHFFDKLFSFLASLLYDDWCWWLARSRDHVMQKAYCRICISHATSKQGYTVDEFRVLMGKLKSISRPSKSLFPVLILPLQDLAKLLAVTCWTHFN